MTPVTTKALIKLKSAKIITINPAVLKNIPFQDFCAILNELKKSRLNMGSVPKAKANIVSAPLIKLPVDKVYTCIDCVNPQGRKNVAIPIRRGANACVAVLALLIVCLAKTFGKANCSRFAKSKTSNKFIPSTSITKPTTTLKTKLPVAPR